MTRLIVILLLTCSKAFAQTTPQPTQFDRFVNKSKIEWATYASDTFNFKGFNAMLLNRLYKKQIKASTPVDSRSAAANDIQYVSIDSIDKFFFNGETDPAGNPKKADSNVFSTTEVTQILYIENGKLKSYIPWVTPTLPVYLSSGKYIGERFYFNSAYNYKYDQKARKKNKLVYLGETKKMIRLDTGVNKLKEMYGRNLLQTLWPQLKKNETAVYNIYDQQINPDTIDLYRRYEKPQPVMIWDSNGAVNKFVVINEAYSGHYSHVQLLQDWYYDHKRNKLFSFIREMYVYVTRKNTGKEDSLLPALKLVFK